MFDLNTGTNVLIKPGKYNNGLNIRKKYFDIAFWVIKVSSSPKEGATL